MSIQSITRVRRNSSHLHNLVFAYILLRCCCLYHSFELPLPFYTTKRAEMETDIIYNNGGPYEHEIASEHHHQVHATQQHQQQNMVSEHHHVVNHEHVPVTTSAPSYEGSCWQFMPPDYPYCSEDDFRYVQVWKPTCSCRYLRRYE